MYVDLWGIRMLNLALKTGQNLIFKRFCAEF